jgi:predicted PurR-regulated permease PerM
MSPTTRNIIIALGFLVLLIGIWYFINIVAYILIAAVFALVGRPIVVFLGRLKYKHFKLPKAICALVALMVLWSLIVLFFRTFVPIIASEISKLSAIDPEKILVALDEPIKNIEHLISKYNIAGTEKFTIHDYLIMKASLVFNETFFAKVFSKFAGMLGNIFIAVFAITFITFFFLRDEKLFAQLLLIVVPEKYNDTFKRAINSSQKLLVRYFVGVIAQLTGIFTLLTLGLTIVGVGFSTSVLIGLMAAMVNIVPYLGPPTGTLLGIILGVANHLDMDFTTGILPLIWLIILVFIIVHTFDNFVSQPFIFSNSVHAHPLEIFLVIMIAGSLAGVIGMVLAIPAYTITRVFAKEFFNNFSVVQKLTKNIQ